VPVNADPISLQETFLFPTNDTIWYTGKASTHSFRIHPKFRHTMRLFEAANWTISLERTRWYFFRTTIHSMRLNGTDDAISFPILSQLKLPSGRRFPVRLIIRRNSKSVAKSSYFKLITVCKLVGLKVIKIIYLNHLADTELPKLADGERIQISDFEKLFGISCRNCLRNALTDQIVPDFEINGWYTWRSLRKRQKWYHVFRHSWRQVSQVCTIDYV
jgi:hypothetical protein